MYQKSIKDIIAKLNTDPSSGITELEASEKLKTGENKLHKQTKKSILAMIMGQLNSALIFVLFAASIVTFIMKEYADSAIILAVVFINATIGMVQEYRAGKAVEALEKLTSPTAIVLREGKTYSIDSKKLVIGDIVLIDAGSYIPADIRIIESASLQIDESSLTGESVSIDKRADALEEELPIADRVNMAYMSTLVTYGRGKGVVVETGMNTEIGKIAGMINKTPNVKTPLEKNLDELGKKLGFLAAGICIVIAIIGLLQGREAFTVLITAISLAVAAIPEGLAAIVAVVLAIGTTKMSKKNAIVKKLSAIETLGSVDIICSDKTGTLTINKMKVKKLYTAKDKIIPAQNGPQSDQVNKLLIAMAIASDAKIDKETQIAVGDPTEIALIDALSISNISEEEFMTNRVHELPFDSDRKLMSVVVEAESGDFNVYTKGAIDNLLDICSHYLSAEGIKPLKEAEKEEFIIQSNKMSSDALRVLASAYKTTNLMPSDEDIEKELIFIGFVGMIDPPRLEVKPSIEIARKAGIKTIMITGDHKITAYSIGKELGIATNMSEVISGNELEKMGDDDLQKCIDNYRVFARVSPEHKLRIVKAFQKNGHVVSMTGDGVNDAPALKNSDIGVAMGITGTDVSKASSDIILLDDNFTTIVTAIEEGRGIFANIKKAVLFLLTCNLGEIIAILVSIILKWPIPLIPTQILWVNLVTDSLPAIALGVDNPDKKNMIRPPRNPSDGFFDKSSLISLAVGGLVVGISSLMAFIYGMNTSIEYGRTMAFMTLSISQLIYAFSIRSVDLSMISTGLFSNMKIVGASALGIILQISILYIPFTASLFKLAPLGLKDIIIVFLLSSMATIIHEMGKLAKRVFPQKI